MSKPREGTDEGRCNPHARMPSKSIQCGRSGYIRLKCLSFHRLYSTQGATNQKIFSGISSTRRGLHGTLAKWAPESERTPYLSVDDFERDRFTRVATDPDLRACLDGDFPLSCCIGADFLT